MPMLHDAASDFALAARHYAAMARARRWDKLLGDALPRWERASPRTYRAARAMFGARSATNPQADPLSSPAPSFGQTLTVDGIVMRVDERMSPYNIAKLASGRHTRHERALLDRTLVPDDTVLELGGGIGMVAIHCARRLGSERVHSFEANPGLESLIRDNYALNDVSPRLRIAMLGRESGTRTFHVGERFSRGSTQADAGDRAIEVAVLPFQKTFDEIAPSVLVVDIQGGEAELLEHADLRSLRVVLIELHADIIGVRRVNAIRRAIRRLGLAERARAGQSFLFVRPDT